MTQDFQDNTCQNNSTPFSDEVRPDSVLKNNSSYIMVW